MSKLSCFVAGFASAFGLIIIILVARLLSGSAVDLPGMGLAIDKSYFPLGNRATEVLNLVDTSLVALGSHRNQIIVLPHVSTKADLKTYIASAEPNSAVIVTIDAAELIDLVEKAGTDRNSDGRARSGKILTTVHEIPSR